MIRRLAFVALAAAFVLVLGPAAFAKTWVFTGAGWGHGLGMSQYGAKGYAEMGWGYADLLRHYYSGTEVRAAPEQVPASVRVGVLPDQNPIHVTATGDFQFVTQGRVVATGRRSESWQIRNESGTFTLRNNGSVVASGLVSPLFVQFESLGSRLQIAEADHWYAYGRLEVSVVASSARAVLDIPSLDKYLYGLGEMPSGWHAEALKAQAVAGRTYAVDKIARNGQNRSGCSCGLYASTLDQAYIGYDKESGDSSGRWRSAVDATTGVLVLQSGSPIQALYSSSSGGATEDNEKVWGGSPVSYLRGVQDDGDFRASPFIGWRSVFSQAEIDSKLASSSSTAVGTLQDIRILDPLGFSRRVTQATPSGGGVTLIGSSGTKTVSGDKLRSVLGLRSTLFQPGAPAYDGRFGGGITVAAGDLGRNGSEEIVTGAGAGGGPHLRVMREDGTVVSQWFAYDAGFTGGIRVAVGDLVGDPNLEIVTGPGAGGGPNVRVWDMSGRLLYNWGAFDWSFTGGVTVAVANKQVIVGEGEGGSSRVRVFTPDGSLVREWQAYPGFRGEVRVAGGNVNAGTVPDEIVTSPGRGGGPHIKVYDSVGTFLGQWFAYGGNFYGGVWVAAADVDGNGEAEVITGADAGGGPHVRAFRGSAAVVNEFFATTAGFTGGVRVSGLGGRIVTGLGPGWWPLYRVWD